jgi:hypothetical protein
LKPREFLLDSIRQRVPEGVQRSAKAGMCVIPQMSQSERRPLAGPIHQPARDLHRSAAAVPVDGWSRKYDGARQVGTPYREINDDLASQ